MPNCCTLPFCGTIRNTSSAGTYIVHFRLLLRTRWCTARSLWTGVVARHSMRRKTCTKLTDYQQRGRRKALTTKAFKERRRICLRRTGPPTPRPRNTDR